MAFLAALLKSVLFLPFGALLEAPFIRLAARVVIPRRLSFVAAYLMALISGAALIAAQAVLWPLYTHIGELGQAGLSTVVALAVASALYGYFLTDEERRSIGFVKGMATVLLSSALFALALLAVAALVALFRMLTGAPAGPAA